MMSKIVKDFYEKYPFPNEIKPKDNYNWILRGLNTKDMINKKILDLGCGTGDMAFIFSEYGNVTGIDFCEHSLEIAKRNYRNIRFIQDDITNLSHKEKYDYIFCIGVLHHIPKISIALDNIKKLMNENTKLIILVYNKYGCVKKTLIKNKELEENISMWKDMYEHPYMKGYSRKEFIRLLREKGFSSIEEKSRRIPEIVRLLTGRGESMIFHVRK